MCSKANRKSDMLSPLSEMTKTSTSVSSHLNPIYAGWTLLPELFEPVHFQFKGIWSVFIIAMFYRNACISCKQ